jgi:mono/diheme cytochrome c family protein
VERLPRGRLDGEGVRPLVLLLLVAAAAGSARAESPLVTNNCLQCHDAELLTQQRLTAKQWAAVVKKMQGWGAPIEPENVNALVSELAGKYGSDGAEHVFRRIDMAQALASFDPQPDGKLGGGDARKGRRLYELACAACHGKDAHGSPTGMNLADRPMLFRAADFAAITRTGRGRMPSFPLQRAEIAAILAYLRTLP